MKKLISGYLERISSKVFRDYHREITQLVGNQHGIYALYKKKRLYYVGLASNLRARVKHHLKDKHKGKWDEFSLFLIHSPRHLKELESLLIRIAKPKGNLTKGSMTRTENLRPTLQKTMEQKNRDQVERILPGGRGAKQATSAVRFKKKRSLTLDEIVRAERAPILEGLLPPGAELRVKYYKQSYSAFVDEKGRIQLGGKLFTSPSMAGSFLRDGKATNGWHFWRYQNAEGKWVKLDELRQGDG